MLCSCECTKARKCQRPSTIPVSMTLRSHLFSYRTQKLSSAVQKVLGWTRPGRICRCRFPNKKHISRCAFYFAEKWRRHYLPRSCPTRAWEARRVKRTIQWIVRSQSERGGCLRQRRSRLCRCRFPKKAIRNSVSLFFCEKPCYLATCFVNFAGTRHHVRSCTLGGSRTQFSCNSSK